MIVAVDAQNIALAAEVHSKSWQQSHKSFCSPEFVQRHTAARQEAYLRGKLLDGRALYMLVEARPVGVVAIYGNLIEDLYILPEEQRKGYGTKLLRFAMDLCSGTPTLWVLSNNQNAYALYTKQGFQKTGTQKKLTDSLAECEMRYVENTEVPATPPHERMNRP